MKKYKLRLDYTADELEELKRLGEDYNSPMTAVNEIVRAKVCNNPFISLWRKYRVLDNNKDFAFMTDINNTVMGTAIFPEKKYVVHDKVTDQYMYYSVPEWSLCWGQPHSGKAVRKTKDEWLAINPAYEPMLEKVEDDE